MASALHFLKEFFRRDFFFFFEQDGTLGTGGGHWKGVNVSLRENRIGHGADADLKRGT